MGAVRVLVTGSRIWKDGLFIRGKLNACLETAREVNENLTIVHGACKSGADSYADAWARWHQRNITDLTVKPEQHPAKWEGPCRPSCQPGHRRPCVCARCRGDQRASVASDHVPGTRTTCPAAGFYRNETMVELGADLVLAFIADESKGATHCARYAEQHGLHVLYFRTQGASGHVAEALI